MNVYVHNRSPIYFIKFNDFKKIYPKNQSKQAKYSAVGEIGYYKTNNFEFTTSLMKGKYRIFTESNRGFFRLSKTFIERIK